MNKIMLSYAFTLLSFPFSTTFAQSITNAEQTELLVNKIHYIDACVISYDQDEDTCSCSFDYLRQHYDAAFYQHPFFKYEGVEPPYQMADSLNDSLQYCEYKTSHLALPRDFYKIQSTSTPSREIDY